MRHLKLLVVEDDPQIAEIQRRFVERLDNVELCGIAHNLTDADDLVDVFQPDLMLLDVFFPDGNGLDLLRQLRARNAHTDIILVTAAREVDTLRAALHGGVFDYILKPLVYERLEEAARHHTQSITGRWNLERRSGRPTHWCVAHYRKALPGISGQRRRVDCRSELRQRRPTGATLSPRHNRC